MLLKSINNKNKHEVLKKLIGKDNPVIIEVGSHFGIDTRKMLASFPKARIYCFEPDPRAQVIFEKYCNDTRVHLIKSAVSDTDEEHVSFYQAYSDDNVEKMLNKYSWIDKEDFLNLKLNRCGASSLKKGHEAVDNANQIQVKTIKLDSWASENDITDVDLMWVDVQGAEKEVFNGAKHLLKQIKYIWTEYGEVEYEGGLSLSQTKKILKEDFKVLNVISIFHKKGDLLLKNRRI